jgi:hypothetical protein
MRSMVYPFLSRRWQETLDERAAEHPCFDLSKRELERIMRATNFKRFKVKSHICRSPLWIGRHLECLAEK